MKNKNGFTLVELLAAIVILGVLMATAAGAFGSIKKNNAKKEAKQLEDSLTRLGETIYTSSIIAGTELNKIDLNIEINATDDLTENEKKEGITSRKLIKKFKLLKDNDGAKKGFGEKLESDIVSANGGVCEAYIIFYNNVEVKNGSTIDSGLKSQACLSCSDIDYNTSHKVCN